MLHQCHFLRHEVYIHDLSNLTSCINTSHAWFCVNRMALNPENSEIILLGTCQQALSYSNLIIINDAGCQIPLANQIKSLGVMLSKN